MVLFGLDGLERLERGDDLRLRGSAVLAEQALLSAGPDGLTSLGDGDGDGVGVDAVGDNLGVRVDPEDGVLCGVELLPASVSVLRRGGEGGESATETSPSSSGPPGTRALERDTATGATRAGVRIKDREMNARENARRDAREDAPGARHLSYLARPGRNGHARGSTSRRRRRATRPRLARARRARGAGGARRGSRAAAGERRPHGGERQVRERRRSHRERSAARARGPARPQPRK